MLIKAKVYPNSKENKIIYGSVLKIYVNKPAKDMKANNMIIEILADFYQIKKKTYQ